jgi:hypothetical protein
MCSIECVLCSVLGFDGQSAAGCLCVSACVSACVGARGHMCVHLNLCMRARVRGAGSDVQASEDRDMMYVLVFKSI